MHEEKLMRMVGLASAVPYDRSDPFNPVNRRISIVVLNKRTEETILREGLAADQDNAATEPTAPDAAATPAPPPSGKPAAR